jgi:choline-sulfatase
VVGWPPVTPKPRRTSRRLALTALALALAPLARGGLAAPARPPSGAARPARSALLISVDTLRADCIGALGGPVPTPGMDGLAREGVLLEQATTPVPSTGPAHASLLTGLYPWRHGTLRNAVPMDPRIPTLAEWARSSGRATAAFVSSYILDRRFGFHQGFDTYVFEPDQSYAWRGQEREHFWALGEHTTRAAMDWITRHAGEPFFVWVHLFDPHAPYLPPPGWGLSPDSPVDLDGKSLPSGVEDRDELARMIRAYRGEVRYADAQVARLVERLRLLDILDQTAVVLTADHGEGLGDHGVLEHGVDLYDELVRVPLIVRAPGVPAGRRLAGPAQLEDVAPTLLALLGAPEPAGLDGVNLLPWLRGEVAASPRAACVGQRRPLPGRPELYYERRWPEKWIGSRDGDGARFQLERDPGERGGRPEGAPPRALVSALAGATAAGRAVDSDPEAQRALEALGYLDD